MIISNSLIFLFYSESVSIVGDDVMLKIKKNWLAFLILFIVLVPICNYTYKFVENREKGEVLQQQQISSCQNDEYYTTHIEYCNQLLEVNTYKPDFYAMMTDMLVFGIRFINPMAFIILVFPTLFNVCKILKRKYIINALTRQSYKEFLIYFFKESFRYVWLLPFLAIIIIIICIFNTSMDPSFSIKYETSMWYANTIRNPFLFIFLYTFNIVIYSVTFVNLALIVLRKYHNFISAVILSVLSYIGIELFFELILNNIILWGIFKSELGHLFNIMNIFTFSDEYGVVTLLLFSISMLLLSSLGVYLAYRKKENLIIDCEKNH